MYKSCKDIVKADAFLHLGSFLTSVLMFRISISGMIKHIFSYMKGISMIKEMLKCKYVILEIILYKILVETSKNC